MASDNTLVLPPTVIGPAELVRIKYELEMLDEALHQASLRAKSTGKAVTAIEKPKPLLSAVAKANDCDLENLGQRQALLKQLDELATLAPTVTISFAVDPSDAFMAKIVAWFRSNVHPAVLIRVGLQPSITAGCRLRTPSKLYDFSLRNKFDEQRPMLVERLRAEKSVRHQPVKAPTVETPVNG